MMVRATVLSAAIAACISVSAQMPSSVDIRLEQDAGAGLLRVSLRANDASFNGMLSNLVFTFRWPESSGATLGVGSSAWCPLPSQAFPVSPTSMVTPGNGFKYRTYFSVGLALLGAIADDGGCEQALPADEWVEVYAIPINGDASSTSFEITDDQFAVDDNRSFFVSLAGIAYTGSIFNFSTAVEAALGSRVGAVLAPNPVDREARVEFPDRYAGPWTVKVLDSTGREAMGFSGNGGAVIVPCAGLVHGAYVAVVSTEKEVHTIHFVVSR